MKNIKRASAAGTFYPADKIELENLLDEFISETPKASDYSSRAIIVPHAGYIYSGKLAVKGYQYLDKNVKNIFIFAPAHYERIYGCAVVDYDVWETPLGEVVINKELNRQAGDFCECHTNNFAFEKEHSIDVQIPIIKKMFPNAQIIPILYGCENFKKLSETIKHFWDNKDNAFVISTDLSHFYPEKESKRIDNYTAKMIEENNTKDFEQEQACGAMGICGIVNFAAEKKYSFIRVGLTNSAAETGDSSRVVGYGSWFLYEGGKSEYIKEYFSDYAIKICKDSIKSGLNLESYLPENYPGVFDEDGACFVTLKINDNLRGCIGSIIAHRPLIQDLYKNAHSSAFSDPRFKPLTIDEFQNVKISVSLLSKPERMSFKDEDDLLSQLVPRRDGLIIREGSYQSVFLPVVWEELSDKKEFLKHLKLKAGLPPNYFSDTFEASRFYAIEIEE